MPVCLAACLPVCLTAWPLLARFFFAADRVREVVKKYSWDRDLQVSEPRLYRRFTLAPEDMEVLEELDEGPFSGDDAGDAKQ